MQQDRQHTTKLIGGPGTGKTKALLDEMDRLVDELGDPFLIGFSSFTRAARREASARAGDRFGYRPVELETQGWFKTVHAVCYKQLGISKGQLVADTKADREWLQDALQEPVHAPDADGEPYAELFVPAGEMEDADRALRLWDAARNRLEGLQPVWREADECDDRTPSLDYCRAVVERYEQAKRLDGRCDFVDLLARFAGWWLDPDGAERCEPDGEPPEGVEAWLLDEQQDNSALLAAVCRRLTGHPDVRHVALCGDPFQEIHSYAGADSAHFLGWGAEEVRRMPRSHRCPAEILRLGERLIRDCSNYFARGIEPRAPGGEVDECWLPCLVDEIDPRDDWLVLARTNWHARRVARLLDDAAVPWRPTKGRKTGSGYTQVAAVEALLSIQAGGPVDGWQWQQILKQQVPSAPYLVRGTKSRFRGMETAQAEWPWVMPGELYELGATPAFLEAVRAGRWKAWVPGAEERVAALARWGEKLVHDPRVRVGTVHSAKGAEADNVALLTTLSRPCALAARSERGRDEEQRVWYVAVTRAKERLLVARESRVAYRKKIE